MGGFYVIMIGDLGNKGPWQKYVKGTSGAIALNA